MKKVYTVVLANPGEADTRAVARAETIDQAIQYAREEFPGKEVVSVHLESNVTIL